MRIQSLILRNFGPFKKYEIQFLEDETTSLLITGKNNEGKSNIIFALKLIQAGLRVVAKKKQEIRLDSRIYYKLYTQDTEDILVRRLIHNYIDETAEIIACFNDGFVIYIFIDPIEKIIYSDYEGVFPKDIENIFGFIPYLGMVAAREEFIHKLPYLKASLNTSLAPRHLRNHLVQLLSIEEYELVQSIINSSWENIELLDCRIDNFDSGRIDCFYKEKKFEREIGWAGQGLQVWFQIIAHLVRLLNTSVLILDEPEINLHPEKQNDLIGIIREYYAGSIIVATHSVELMNNVNVDHIIHVRKDQSSPQVKSTSERRNLEIIRSHIGSNFNFISSQFESVDVILFTEDTEDFKIISKLADSFGFKNKLFNIPIHGFCEYKKAVHYKDAYKMLIGKSVLFTLVLDKDYYPSEYLEKIRNDLKQFDIKVVFTPGKEIENLFINPKILSELLDKDVKPIFESFFESLFSQEERNDAFGSFIKLHENFLPSKIDTKIIVKQYKPIFDTLWDDKNERFNFIAGKKALHQIRKFYKEQTNKNLSNNLIYEKIVEKRDKNALRFIKEIFQK